MNFAGAVRRDHEAQKRFRTACSAFTRDHDEYLGKTIDGEGGTACDIFQLLDFVVWVREVGGREAGPLSSTVSFFPWLDLGIPSRCCCCCII